MELNENDRAVENTHLIKLLSELKVLKRALVNHGDSKIKNSVNYLMLKR